MSTDRPRPPQAPHADPDRDRDERQRFVRTAVALGGAIVVLTLLFVVIAGAVRSSSPGSHLPAQAGVALDRPDAGQRPDRPGARGGWEQLALLGLLVAALGGGATGVVHSSRKARRQRDLAAADPVRR